MIVACFAASIYFYTHFPDRVPTHWNFRGEIDGWSSRGFGAFFVPFLLLGMYFLFLLLPLIDPKRERYADFRKAYAVIRSAIIFILALIYFLAGFAGLGFDVPIGSIVPFVIGILFIVLGNYMGKIKLNWMVGMRNPWTLSSEEVWNKTNRLSGKLFIFAGIIMMSQAFLPDMIILPVFIITILAMVIIPNVYSYIIFRKQGVDGKNSVK